MQLENNHLFHIYNRGNNSQIIFFNRNNYLFFLGKINQHILPFADVLAWCLMPNHFHLLIFVNETEIDIKTEQINLGHQERKTRSLNHSIAIILRSYTRAINKQENRTGSLFQARTKASCLTDISGISPSWFQTNYGTKINIPDPDKAYLQVCFHYIHQNPVISGLVEKPEDWEFSSFRDYSGIRQGQLINRSRAIELGLQL